MVSKTPDISPAVAHLRRCFDHVLLSSPSFASNYSDLPPLDRRLQGGEAAVLILLQRRGSEWFAFFTVRSASLRLHGGEVSFPGGQRDAGDESPAATALRECHEEVGLPPEKVELVGTLRPLVNGHRMLLHAVVGVLKAEWPLRLSAEVERTFWAPMRMFVDERNYRGAFDVMNIRMHRFEFETEQIHGLTANLCVILSMLLHRRLPPFRLATRPLPADLSVGQIAKRQFEETHELLSLFDRLDERAKEEEMEDGKKGKL